eukprot:1194525-Prorocentrum_minimum.AAC.4
MDQSDVGRLAYQCKAASSCACRTPCRPSPPLRTRAQTCISKTQRVRLRITTRVQISAYHGVGLVNRSDSEDPPGRLYWARKVRKLPEDEIVSQYDGPIRRRRRGFEGAPGGVVGGLAAVQLEPKGVQLALELHLTGRAESLRHQVLVHVLHHGGGEDLIQEAVVLRRLLGIHPVHPRIHPVHPRIHPVHPRIRPIHSQIHPVHPHIHPVHPRIHPLLGIRPLLSAASRRPTWEVTVSCVPVSRS